VKFSVVLWMTLLAAPAIARDAPQCNEAGTQQELNACAADEFKQADRALNEAYAALLKKESGDRTFIKKLRVAQRAWLAFRDAEMEATFACDPAQSCWGSMLPMSMASYKARLTRDRTQRLREMLDQGRGVAAGM
jgi:uncharacterized protein YecT (DUF1311 family)